MYQRTPETAVPDATPRSVLVVDDDPILRELMRERLGALGWSVTEAEHGDAALTQLAHRVPDLAIVDLSMPTLDGFALLRSLRQNPRTIDLPVIVCTGLDENEAVEEAYRLGASSFMTKPINWVQFLHHARFVMRSGETERALRAAESEAVLVSRSKSAMFRVLSHELKTPLTALIGLTSVVERQLRGKTELGISQELEHVIEASLRLNTIVSDIMLLSKAVAGPQDQYAPESLAGLIEDGVAGLKGKAAQRNVRLLLRAEDTDAHILCDSRLIHQALARLVDNAIRFSDPGSTVEVLGHTAADGSAVLSVRDYGPGLSAPKLRECLRPFLQEDSGYSRSAEGLGLGLPIAKAICEAHGGELAIQTAPGKGMLAAIMLPPRLLTAPALKHAS
jgi:two-component system, sensor histidine kinase and response regulator